MARVSESTAEVPDHVPEEWRTETAQHLLVRTWEALRPLVESAGSERVRYIIVPEVLYDFIYGTLNEDSEWLCPDGYWVTVVFTDDPL